MPVKRVSEIGHSDTDDGVTDLKPNSTKPIQFPLAWKTHITNYQLTQFYSRVRYYDNYLYLTVELTRGHERSSNEQQT